MSTIPQTLRPTPAAGDPVAALLATRAGRLLLPSLADLLFIAFFAWLFAAGGAGWSGLLADGDTGWHIRTGEWILDHRSVPHQDLFSFTKTGAPWYAWEWLSDIAMAGLHRAGGLKAVVFPFGLLIAVWPVVLLRQALWRGAHPWLALAVVLPGIGAASMHFLARPHVITLLFGTAAAWVIEADLRASSRWLWLLVPLTVLWTNLHGGFLVVIALAGVTAAGCAAEAWTGVRSWMSPVRYLALAGACAAASVINPYGIGLHRHAIAYLRSDWIRNVVQEFQAPTFRSENQLQFEALLFVGLAAAAILASRKRFVHALWIVVFAHFALTSVRHVPVYVAIIIPLVAETATLVWEPLAARAGKKSLLAIFDAIGRDTRPAFLRVSVCSLVFLCGYLVLTPAARWPSDFPSERFPVAIVERHRDLIAKARILSDDQWGDYLIYLNYPGQRVFADGRSDFYGAELGGEYIRATQGGHQWRHTLDRYRVDTVLAPVDWALATLLKSDPQWRIVEDDGRAILLVRRAASN